MEKGTVSAILERFAQRVETCVLDTADRPNRHKPCLCNKDLTIKELNNCYADMLEGLKLNEAFNPHHIPIHNNAIEEAQNKIREGK